MPIKRPPLLALLIPLLLVGCKPQSLIGPGASAPSTDAPLYMRMTDQDVALADEAVQRALESNRSMTTLRWKNSASENSGEITPVRTYRNLLGHFCRTYRESLKIGRSSESYTDTACRSENGRWYPI